MTTSARTNINGQPRKTLASQIDRLDGILDGLDAALAGAVQEAVEQAVKQAVQTVLTEVLTNRALQEQLQQAAQPAPPPEPPLGMLITSPTVMRLGFVICGLAASSAANEAHTGAPSAASSPPSTRASATSPARSTPPRTHAVAARARPDFDTRSCPAAPTPSTD